MRVSTLGAALTLATVFALATIGCASSKPQARAYVPDSSVGTSAAIEEPHDAGVDALYGRLGWRDLAERDGSAELPSWVAVSPDRLNDWGVTLTRLRKAANPDPTFIKRWEDEATRETFLQAAINKSWGKDCRADYYDYKTRWKALDERYRPKIAELAKLSYYEATRALVALHNELLAEAGDLYLGQRRWAPRTKRPVHPMAYQGVAFDIAAALVEVQRDNGRARYARDVLELLQDPQGRSIGDEYTTLGAPMSDDSTARKLFCRYAAEVGTHRTPPLPIVPGVRPDDDAVSWDVWASASGPKPPLANVASAHDGTPNIVYDVQQLSTRDVASNKDVVVAVRPYEVAHVERSGAVLDLTLRVHEEAEFPVHCVGVGRDVEACTHGTETTETIARIHFDDVPDSVEIRVGDLVGVDGKLLAMTTRRVLDERLQKLTKRTLVLQGTHIRTVARDDRVLLALGPY